MKSQRQPTEEGEKSSMDKEKGPEPMEEEKIDIDLKNHNGIIEDKLTT